MPESENTLIPLAECSHCGNEFSPDDLDGDDRCGDCADLFTTCDDCGDECLKSDLNRVESADQHVCDSCLDRHYGRCSACDEIFVLDDLNGDNYCEGCAEDYTSCDNCGRTVYIDNAENVDDDTLCGRCARHRSRDDRGVHDYSYKPQPAFHGKGELFIGFELELEVNCDAPDIIGQSADLLYAKTDGSLDCGFEIVSHPFSESWYRENVQTLSAMLKRGRDHGAKSHNSSTCGLHIHLTRRAFTSLHEYKLSKLIYENPGQILTFSRRKQAILDRWASLDVVERDRISLAKYKNQSAARYVAVNMTRHTIELRFCRGTLRQRSFLAVMEFGFAAYNFTQNISLADTTWKNFAAYVHENRKQYENLWYYLSEKGLL